MKTTEKASFHALKATRPNGQPYSFKDLSGKVVLVVNTATKCGLTPQFAGLEALHQKYKDQGLAVIGFPCDQFAHQEPLQDVEMEEVCRVNHGVTFSLMAKSDVNGPETNEVFRYLKQEDKGLLGDDIKWNFTKFLVSRDGSKVTRFAPTTVPEDLVKDIEKALM